jgi:hypothetical protein
VVGLVRWERVEGRLSGVYVGGVGSCVVDVFSIINSNIGLYLLVNVSSICSLRLLR